MNHPDSTSRRVLGTTGLLLGSALAVALAACHPADNDPPTTPAPAAADAPAASPVPTPPGDAAAPGATVRQSQWQCGDERVSARFDQATQTVTVVHSAGELMLQQAAAASGARYADANGNEFWTKGPGGTLTLSGTPARECTEVANPTAITPAG
jgi:membrane-bound inhibitor of C-type lysozyme